MPRIQRFRQSRLVLISVISSAVTFLSLAFTGGCEGKALGISQEGGTGDPSGGGGDTSTAKMEASEDGGGCYYAPEDATIPVGYQALVPHSCELYGYEAAQICLSDGGWSREPGATLCDPASCYYGPLDASFPVDYVLTLSQSCGEGGRHSYQITCSSDGGWSTEPGFTECEPVEGGSSDD